MEHSPLSSAERVAFTLMALSSNDEEHAELQKLVWTKVGPGRWKSKSYFMHLMDSNNKFMLWAMFYGRKSYAMNLEESPDRKPFDETLRDELMSAVFDPDRVMRMGGKDWIATIV